MLRSTLLCVILAQVLLCATDSPTESLESNATESVKSNDGRENQLESGLYHHFQHLTYVAEFVCREPQARVLPVERLLPSVVTWGKAYFPDVTVIHICENSGACSSGYRCGPSHVRSVHLPFKVTYLEDTEHHKKGSWSMEFHLLENHTHCACAEETLADRPEPVALNPTPPTSVIPPNSANFNPSYNPSNSPNYNPSNSPNYNSNISPNIPTPLRPPMPPTLNGPSSTENV